jgi:hypothetical protein
MAAHVGMAGCGMAACTCGCGVMILDLFLLFLVMWPDTCLHTIHPGGSHVTPHVLFLLVHLTTHL